ncbi:MAG: NUDIX domain-containing protein [Leucobacter sp.]
MFGRNPARPDPVPHSPDEWADGEHGRFWGRYGAAGILIHNSRAEVMLQLRADWCHHGGTWSIPGGARAYDESAIQAAFREAGEEHDLPSERVRITGSHVLDFGYWSYVTFVGLITEEWDPRILTSEAVDVRWVSVEEVTGLMLHPGFRNTWPHVQDLVLRSGAQ